MSRRLNSALVVLATLATAVVATGCSPPETPLDVGVRDVSTDVIIGRRPPSPDAGIDTGSTVTSSTTTPP